VSASAIEKGIPMPERAPRRSWRVFDEMEPGDSISVPQDAKWKAWNALQSYKRRRPGRVFATASDGDVLRIWRQK
jgi:hypothetical protein